MAYTVSANDSTPESFAGLLDRLTRRVGLEGRLEGSLEGSPADRNSDRGRNLDGDLDRLSISRAGAASSSGMRRRALVPVMERNSRASRLSDEAMQLSYEKALRLHSRHSAAGEADLELPRDKTPNSNTSQTAGAGFEYRGTEAPEIGSAGSVRKTISTAQRGITPGNTQGVAARRTRGYESDTQQIIDPGVSEISKKNAVVRRAGPRASIKLSQNVEPAKSRSKSSTAAAFAVARSRSTPSSRASRGKRGVAAQPLTSEDPKQAKELGLEISQLNRSLEHRHAVVSMRLSDSELDRLRHRAAESGISISAYMRSCILDAEGLRSQVKQALVEMRASMGQREPAQLSNDLSVLADAGNSGSSAGGAWPRLLWKSATLLFGWFSFRHRA
jgi:hypothetical protein